MSAGMDELKPWRVAVCFSGELLEASEQMLELVPRYMCAIMPVRIHIWPDGSHGTEACGVYEEANTSALDEAARCWMAPLQMHCTCSSTVVRVMCLTGDWPGG